MKKLTKFFEVLITGTIGFFGFYGAIVLIGIIICCRKSFFDEVTIKADDLANDEKARENFASETIWSAFDHDMGRATKHIISVAFLIAAILFVAVWNFFGITPACIMQGISAICGIWVVLKKEKEEN